MPDLEQRIQRLEDIEAIRQLQAKYQRCLDTRAFKEMEDCFTPDAVSSYDNGKMSFQGRDGIMSFLKEKMSLDMPSSHMIHGGEIEISDECHATAKWYLEDLLLHKKFCVKLNGAAVYDVGYTKECGIWKISRIGYQRCYQYVERRTVLNLFTLCKTCFLDAAKKRRRR